VTYVVSGLSRTAIRGVGEGRRSERVRLKADTTYVVADGEGLLGSCPLLDGDRE